MNPPQVYTCSPSWTLLPPHTIRLGRPSALAPSIQYRASNLDWQSFLTWYFTCLNAILPNLPTLSLSQISGHFCFLVSGQRSDTEERLATRGGQHEQRKERRTAPEMQGTTDSNPAVKLRLCTSGATGDFKNTYKPEKGISETDLTPHCPQEIQRPSWIYWRTFWGGN